MYRLVIDIPLGEDLDQAKEDASNLLSKIRSTWDKDDVEPPSNINDTQYRLSHDGDRTPKNYMNIDGDRALTRKLKVFE